MIKIPERGWQGLPKISKTMYKASYLVDNEKYEDWIDRIANAYANNKEHAERLATYLHNYWFHPATPISSNGGLPERGEPISCFVREVEDSKEGIFYAYNEAFWLGSRGTGIGTTWDAVREVGADVGNIGKSSGVIPFLGISDRSTLAISQGALRRASESVYLSIEHPEIVEFINMRKPDRDPNRCNPNVDHGVLITDAFMEAVEAREEWNLISRKTGEVVQTVDAFDLWTQILDVRARTRGEPYCIFIDQMNREAPEEYKALDHKIKLSNLCVTGDTKILTKEGYKTIGTIVGEKHSVWNGSEWSDDVEIVKTSKGQAVLEVQLSNYTTIKATPYHKWYIQQGYGASNVVMKRTHELQPSDKLIKHELEPVTHGTNQLELAYENGFYTGDGTKVDSRQRVYLYDDKRTLLPRFSGYISSRDTDGRIELLYSSLKPKFFIPDTSYSVKSRLDWFAGLCDSDGTLTNNNGTESIQIGSVNLDFLKDVLLLLQELGVHSSISKLHDAGYRMMPANDGTNTNKEFWCNTTYRLLIAGSQLNQLLDLGFSPSRVVPTRRNYQREARQFVKVVAVIDNKEIAPTYCATEPKRNRLVFNGVVTGNCTEIALHTSPTKSNICVLSSLNLAYFDEYVDKLDLIVGDILDFLDNVTQAFIDNTEGKPGFERARVGAMEDRPLGLGVMGFHDYLQSKHIPWESALAVSQNNRIFALIEASANRHMNLVSNETTACPASLAAKKVNPELPYRRNIVTTAIAPTMSISNLCNLASSGVEPNMANSYTKKLKQGSFPVRNKYLDTYLYKVAEEHSDDINEWVNQQWALIAKDGGSVQQLDWMDGYTKDVFKTAYEIDQNWVVDLAANRQRYIAQSQSINLFFPAGSHVSYIYNVHMRAWKQGMKSLYYQRSSAAHRASISMNNRKHILEPTECIACQ